MEKSLSNVAWHLEEPRVGQSYPNYYIAKEASKFVKVILSGAGGDELFGGYPWRYYRTTVNNNFDDYIDKYYLYWQRLLDNSQLKKIFLPIYSETKNVWTRDIFANVFKTRQKSIQRPVDYINHSLYFEAKTFLHGLFVVEDKLSMASSIETRLPFMDNDVVDFAMNCPVDLKLKNIDNIVRLNENFPGNKTAKYFQRTNDGKKILRDVMSKYLPIEIIDGKKQGFSSPDASWFKNQSISFVKDKLINGNPRLYNILDGDSIIPLINEHLSGKENRRLLIWSLLNVEYFLCQHDLN